MADTPTIKSMMEENRKFDPPENLRKNAWIKSFDEYKKMYDRSINDPEGFWGEVAGTFEWNKKWNKVRDYDFRDKIDIKFFDGGQTNITLNCLDRHIKNGKGNKIALIFEGNEPNQNRTLTYQQLLNEVCRFANALKKNGVKRGDRVSIYMPMILELPIAMLACARIGAIHSIVFGGFSADALRDRILDSGCKVVITTDGAWRGQKAIPMKGAADDAMRMCEEAKGPVNTCIVFKHTNTEVPMKAGRDIWWHDAIEGMST